MDDYHNAPTGGLATLQDKHSTYYSKARPSISKLSSGYGLVQGVCPCKSNTVSITTNLNLSLSKTHRASMF
jgi:hypothetical protein